MTELSYAKVGGPPARWQKLKIIDLDTGLEVSKVVEVNTTEGWLIRYREDAEGRPFIDPEKPDQAARERVEGRFQIVRPT